MRPPKRLWEGIRKIGGDLGAFLDVEVELADGPPSGGRQRLTAQLDEPVWVCRTRRIRDEAPCGYAFPRRSVVQLGKTLLLIPYHGPDDDIEVTEEVQEAFKEVFNVLVGTWNRAVPESSRMRNDFEADAVAELAPSELAAWLAERGCQCWTWPLDVDGRPQYVVLWGPADWLGFPAETDEWSPEPADGPAAAPAKPAEAAAPAKPAGEVSADPPAPTPEARVEAPRPEGPKEPPPPGGVPEAERMAGAPEPLPPPPRVESEAAAGPPAAAGLGPETTSEEASPSREAVATAPAEGNAASSPALGGREAAEVAPVSGSEAEGAGGDAERLEPVAAIGSSSAPSEVAASAVEDFATPEGATAPLAGLATEGEGVSPEEVQQTAAFLFEDAGVLPRSPSGRDGRGDGPASAPAPPPARPPGDESRVDAPALEPSSTETPVWFVDESGVLGAWIASALEAGQLRCFKVAGETRALPGGACVVAVGAAAAATAALPSGPAYVLRAPR